MPQKRKSVFFVGHEAHRTGAPISLLYLIKWFYENLDYKIYILLIQGGPLEEEYRKFGKVLLYGKEKPFRGYIRNMELRLLLGTEKPEFIYFNTVASIKLLHRFKRLFIPFKKILHVHEMPFSIQQLIGKSFDLKDFSKILVVNKEIKKFLESKVDDSSIINLTSVFLNIKNWETENLRKNEPGKRIVLGVGVASWRKGFDFFLQTAAISKRVNPGKFNFIWVGPSENVIQEQIEYEIGLLGLLPDEFTFIGESLEVKKYYEKADLFFLSSREDPYPLVMLEASFYKLPILYFQHSGGAEDFIDTPDFEIPFGDCHSAAIKIRTILDSLDDYKKELENFKSKAKACDIELVIPKLVDFILGKRDEN